MLLIAMTFAKCELEVNYQKLYRSKGKKIVEMYKILKSRGLNEDPE